MWEPGRVPVSAPASSGRPTPDNDLQPPWLTPVGLLAFLIGPPHLLVKMNTSNVRFWPVSRRSMAPLGAVCCGTSKRSAFTAAPPSSLIAQPRSASRTIVRPSSCRSGSDRNALAPGYGRSAHLPDWLPFLFHPPGASESLAPPRCPRRHSQGAIGSGSDHKPDPASLAARSSSSRDGRSGSADMRGASHGCSPVPRRRLGCMDY